MLAAQLIRVEIHLTICLIY